VIFVGLVVAFLLAVVLTAFVFGGAAVPVIIALVGVVVFGVAVLAGGSGRGGLRGVLDRAERRGPGHLGPGGPDDPDVQ
jgi:hypothetical protein